MDSAGDQVELRTAASFVGVEVTRAVRKAAAGPARLHDRWTLSLLEDGEEQLWRHGALEMVREGDVAIFAPGEIEVVLRRTAASSRRTDVCFDEVPLPMRGAASTLVAETAARVDVARAIRHFAEAARGASDAKGAEPALRTLGAALRAAPTEPSSHAEPGSVARARRFLLGQPCVRVNLQELAEVAGISEGHLVRTFHSWVGVPPHMYLQYLRVAAARGLLARGLSCGAAAQKAGFADSSHLTRVFRRLLGFTPSRYAEARAVWDPPRAAGHRWSQGESLTV